MSSEPHDDTVVHPVGWLGSPVEILVDRWGVSHLYASSLDDAFFAQGFNAARDRLWQIDLWRRRGLGILSEVFGPDFVEKDRAARLFLYRGDMRSEWLAYGSDTKRVATAFVSGINEYVRLTQEDPNLLPEEFRALGYGPEVVHHGWVHENPADFDRDGEKRNLELTLQALDDAAGVRPEGYRSPAWDFSGNTVDLLLEYGFLYDSSCMGNDFYPYYLRKGDEWSTTEPYVFGEACELVEIPVTWGLDDFPVSEYVAGQNAGLMPPSAVEEIWSGDFAYAHANCPGGVYDLTMHPQVIGRGHRMLMLERLVDRFEAYEGVVFESLGDHAKRWKAANPLDAWKTANPVYARRAG